MKLKRVMALTLASVMTLSAVGCGSTDTTASADKSEKQEATTTVKEEKTPVADIASLNDGKLVIWTLANDLIDFGERFEAETGVDVETVVIEPADYPT